MCSDSILHQEGWKYEREYVKMKNIFSFGWIGLTFMKSTIKVVYLKNVELI